MNRQEKEDVLWDLDTKVNELSCYFKDKEKPIVVEVLLSTYYKMTQEGYSQIEEVEALLRHAMNISNNINDLTFKEVKKQEIELDF